MNTTKITLLFIIFLCSWSLFAQLIENNSTSNVLQTGSNDFDLYIDILAGSGFLWDRYEIETLANEWFSQDLTKKTISSTLIPTTFEMKAGIKSPAKIPFAVFMQLDAYQDFFFLDKDYEDPSEYNTTTARIGPGFALLFDNKTVLMGSLGYQYEAHSEADDDESSFWLKLVGEVASGYEDHTELMGGYKFGLNNYSDEDLKVYTNEFAGKITQNLKPNSSNFWVGTLNFSTYKISTEKNIWISMKTLDIHTGFDFYLSDKLLLSARAGYMHDFFKVKMGWLGIWKDDDGRFNYNALSELGLGSNGMSLGLRWNHDLGDMQESTLYAYLKYESKVKQKRARLEYLNGRFPAGRTVPN